MQLFTIINRAFHLERKDSPSTTEIEDLKFAYFNLRIASATYRWRLFRSCQTHKIRPTTKKVFVLERRYAEKLISLTAENEGFGGILSRG